MEKEVAVNKVTRDLITAGLVSEDWAGNVKFHLGLLWTAGYDYRTKELLAHNSRKVIQYNGFGAEIARFKSVVEASRANKCHRSVIDEVLRGERKLTEKGYYFRYADEQHQNNS